MTKMRDAVAAALASELGTEGTEESEAPETTEEAPTSGFEVEGSSEVEPSTTESTPPEGPEATGEEIAEYFGLDLSEFPPEKRKEIVERFEKQNDLIQRLQREKAEGGTVAPEPVVEPPVEYTDEDLMQAFGFDPNDPMYEMKSEIALPLVKALAETYGTVQQMQQERTVEKAAVYWDSTLNKMRAENGNVPFTNEEIAIEAFKKGIDNPETAYWSISAGPRQQVQKEIDAERRAFVEELRKSQAGNLRPAPNAASDDVELESTTVGGKRGAVQEFLRKAAASGKIKLD